MTRPRLHTLASSSPLQTRASLTVAILIGCAPGSAPADASVADVFTDVSVDVGYPWQLPVNLPIPRVPPENPMTPEKVALGRYLFYDTRLSANSTTSCASCHQQIHAFSDGRAQAVGSTGMLHRRSAMSLTNVAYNAAFTWADSDVRRLEEQVRLPMYGTAPIELGVAGHETEILARLRADARYVPMFQAAFPREQDAFTMPNVERCLASFVRTLISANSPYDRWVRGDATALSPAAQRGHAQFFGERFNCYQCHTGFNLSGPFVDRTVVDEPAFHNTGLYNVDGLGSYPASDQGLFERTGRSEDMGRFRAPTLRNIALTAPYMHDGSVATLEGVLAHYAAGGRTITTGPNAGAGSTSPHRDPGIRGFVPRNGEVDDLLAFLHSLTDWDFVADPRIADPFLVTPDH